MSNQLIRSAKSTIKNENERINILKQQIEEYETIIYVMSLLGNQEEIKMYNQKINECCYQINISLDKIQDSKKIIDIMEKNSKLSQRSEEVA